MLRAVEAALKPNGRHVFYAITLTAGISDEERARAIRLGNEHVDAGPGHAVLMEQAGFDQVEVTDVSDGYLVTMERWTRAWQDDSVALSELVGDEEYQARMERQAVDIAAVKEGLLKRYLVSGVKP